MTIFAYSRVSTVSQNTSNQKLEIQNAGFSIDYFYEDIGVSGKVFAKQRSEFSKLLNQIRDGETLVVTKLDRLGRDVVDILTTIRYLTSRNIEVIVLQLGKFDLTSTAGKLLLTMLMAVAEMERDLLVERTKMGLLRAKAEGKKLGRPKKTNTQQRKEIIQKLEEGKSVSEVARIYGISRASVISIRKINQKNYDFVTQLS